MQIKQFITITKRKRSVLLTKDMQMIISPLEQGEKGTTNLALEFKISKQHIKDVHKNKGEILKFTNSIETNEGLKIHKYLQSVHKFK